MVIKLDRFQKKRYTEIPRVFSVGATVHLISCAVFGFQLGSRQDAMNAELRALWIMCMCNKTMEATGAVASRDHEWLLSQPQLHPDGRCGLKMGVPSGDQLNCHRYVVSNNLKYKV